MGQAVHACVTESLATQVCCFSKEMRRHLSYGFAKKLFLAKLCVSEFKTLKTQIIKKWSKLLLKVKYFLCNIGVCLFISTSDRISRPLTKYVEEFKKQFKINKRR